MHDKPPTPLIAPPVAAHTAPSALIVPAAAASEPAARSFSHNRDRLRRRLLAVADLAAISVALVLALTLTSAHDVGRQLLWGSLTIPGWVVLFKTYGLYERDTKRISHTSVDDIPQLFHAILAGTVLLWLFFDIGPTRKVVFLSALTFGATALLTVLVSRALVRTATRRLLAPERALILGEGEIASSLVRKLRAHPELAVEPVTITRGSTPECDVIEDLESLARFHRLERVILVNTEVGTDELLKLLSACRRLLLKVSVVPTVFEAMGPAVEIDDVEGVTVLGLNPPALSRSSRLVKRTIDIVGAGTLLLLTAPILLLIAIAIKLDSRGPVLFRQERIGKGGRAFQIVKFRTMVDGAERARDQLLSASEDPYWLKLAHDPRITRLGRVLRKSSLDELPQLWNVLTGVMSLVGPRPLPESEDSLVEGWGRGRLDLTPGITGYWQVLGRSSIPFTEMIKLDYIYVTNWSLWTDVRLILRTLPAVLTGRGVN